MTDDDARKVAQIISEVDNGCHVCVGTATDELLKLLPGHDWVGLVGELWDDEDAQGGFAEMMREAGDASA